MNKIILTPEEQKQLDEEEKKAFMEERKRILKERGKEKAIHDDDDIVDRVLSGTKKVFKGIFK